MSMTTDNTPAGLKCRRVANLEEETVNPEGAHGKMKSGGLLPKIYPLPGSLQPELKRCGKPICRCTRGELHGPYWYRRWREGGRQRRAYVKVADLEQVWAAMDLWHRLHPPIWPLRKVLAELSQINQTLEV